MQYLGYNNLEILISHLPSMIKNPLPCYTTLGPIPSLASCHTTAHDEIITYKISDCIVYPENLVIKDNTLMPCSFRVVAKKKLFLNNNSILSKVGENNYILGDKYASLVCNQTLNDCPYFLMNIRPGFGHFLTEGLSRMLGIEYLRKEGIQFKILTNNNLDKEYVFFFFKHWGILRDDIIFIDHPVNVKTLISTVPSIGFNTYIANTWISIADKIKMQMKPRINRDLKIYLSRANVPRRKLVNESQIEELFTRFGFLICPMEKLSIQEQLNLITNASHVAGPLGSAFHLTLFVENIKILYLCPQYFPALTTYIEQARVLRNSSSFIFGFCEDRLVKNSDNAAFSICINTLEESLKLWLTED